MRSCLLAFLAWVEEEEGLAGDWAWVVGVVVVVDDCCCFRLRRCSYSLLSSMDSSILVGSRRSIARHMYM
jgi:hypothetical protein